jgi:hypothetical protein
MGSLTIKLTVLAFTSSGLAASQMYIWMPITLVVGVGAVMQVFVLIIEEADREGEAKDRRKAWRYIQGLSSQVVPQESKRRRSRG